MLQDQGKIVELGAGAPSESQVAEAIENMARAAIRVRGAHDGYLVVSDGFAKAFARWAVESGRPSVWVFAMQAALQAAVADEQVKAALTAGSLAS